MEQILAIKPWLGKKDWEHSERQQGYQITTSQQRIRLGISTAQKCCESWGYLWSHDDPQEFIGAAVLSISLTDGLHRTIDPLKAKSQRQNYTNTLFVTIETDRGTLQFTAYNHHNGYYGHEVKIHSQQFQYMEVL